MTNRDPATGKFLIGNNASEGHGSRPRKIKDTLLERLIDATGGEWDGINAAMIKQAKKGNVQAARYLAEYAIGKPTQKVELSAGDNALLDKLLKHFQSRGMSPGDVFALMIAQFAEVDGEGEQDG
jgi:hypothetical protein